MICAVRVASCPVLSPITAVWPYCLPRNAFNTSWAAFNWLESDTHDGMNAGTTAGQAWTAAQILTACAASRSMMGLPAASEGGVQYDQFGQQFFADAVT
jgi:hypothetical protein